MAFPSLHDKTYISKELSNFLHLPLNVIISRAQVGEMMTRYMVLNNLMTMNQTKFQFCLNEDLATLFDLDHNVQKEISYADIQQKIVEHFVQKAFNTPLLLLYCLDQLGLSNICLDIYYF